jgi:hypothetical protein
MDAWNNRPVRRGGPNGVTCLGNNEPDGKPYIATWNGISVGAKTREEANIKLRQIRDLDKGIK